MVSLSSLMCVDNHSYQIRTHCHTDDKMNLVNGELIQCLSQTNNVACKEGTLSVFPIFDKYIQIDQDCGHRNSNVCSFVRI